MARIARHKNADCERALVGLRDGLCEWERTTGRQSTLILIPHNTDEQIIVAVNGKPALAETPEDLAVILANAMRDRPEKEAIPILQNICG